MKGTPHSEEQIIAILKQGEPGLTTAETHRPAVWLLQRLKRNLGKRRRLGPCSNPLRKMREARDSFLLLAKLPLIAVSLR
jgi:hypothetical protein